MDALRRGASQSRQQAVIARFCIRRDTEPRLMSSPSARVQPVHAGRGLDGRHELSLRERATRPVVRRSALQNDTHLRRGSPHIAGFSFKPQRRG